MKIILERGKLLFLLILLTLLLIIPEKSYCSDLFKFNFHSQSQNLLRIAKKLNIKSEEIIVYFIYPKAAPRIESLIYSTYEEIRKERFDGAIIGIINYPKYWFAKDFVAKMEFPFKCIIDTSFEFWKEITILDPLVPTIVTRWNNKGYLLNYLDLYGYKGNLRGFLKNNIVSNIQKTQYYRTKNGYLKEDFKNLKFLTPKRHILISEDSNSFFGLISSFKIIPNVDKIFLLDRGTYTWKSYDIINKQVGKEIDLDLKTRKMFSQQLSDSLFVLFENKYSFAKYMLMDGILLNDSIFLIIGVLPDIRQEISSQDTFIYAYSKFSFIHYNYKRGEGEKAIPIKLEQIPDGFSAIPYSSLRSLNKNKSEVALVAAKGYPTSGFTKPTDTSYILNPITESFYNFTPLFFVFNYETGEFTRTIGRLGPSHQKLAMGYYMCMPVIRFLPEEDYCFVQSLSEFIETSKRKIEIKSYFESSLLSQNIRPVDSLPDVEFYRHISDSAKAQIQDITYSKNRIYLMWKLKEQNKSFFDSEILLIQKYDFTSGNLIEEYLVPSNYNGFKFSTHFVDTYNNSLYCLFYNSLNTLIVEYILN